MPVYHGHPEKDFVLTNQASRYGFPVLFFTNNIILAKNYSKGGIIMAEIDYFQSFDYRGGISHSAHFRNLIHDLYKKGTPSVVIKNVYDSPNHEYSLEKSDLYVVFDFSRIKNIQPCTA